MEIQVTLDPYVPFIEEIASMSSVTGVRFNTAGKLKEPLDQLLSRLRSQIYPKDLWVDLKCRQLRVVNKPTVPPDYVEISHNIKVDTSADDARVYFKEKRRDNFGGPYEEIYRSVKLEKVVGNLTFLRGGNKLLLRLPPSIKSIRFGPGAALSIPHPSLKVYGYLTRKDEELMGVAKPLDIHKYMISFVEQEGDVKSIFSRDPNAEIGLKIETERGLEFVDKVYPKLKKEYEDKLYLIAARGDMYIWLEWPHYMLKALKKIIKADPNAVAASRIFPSLTRINIEQERPACQDICDVGYLFELGYKRFLLGDELLGDVLLGDEVCYDKNKLETAKNRLKTAVGLLSTIGRDYL